MKKKIKVSKADLFNIRSTAINQMKSLSKDFCNATLEQDQRTYCYLQSVILHLNSQGAEIELDQEILDHPDRFLKRG